MTAAPRQDRPLLLVALGGNALLRRGEPLEARLQEANIARAAASIAGLAETYTVVVTHGNGPQVGLLALQAAAYRKVEPYPLDVLGAETEGMIGYLLEQSFRNAQHDRPTATLLTQVVVDSDDPAFTRPTKPIGPTYKRNEALRIARERGWTVAPDGDSFRRVVPSPEPREIVELSTIRLLVDAGVLVICGGGGGIPVIANGHGVVHGVEAVVDKDLSAALLASRLGADVLLLLTDVPAVEHDWGTAQAGAIHRTTPQNLRRIHFENGSMGPKVEAACRFVENGGQVAAIGALEEAAAIVAGRAGTCVTRENASSEPTDFSVTDNPVELRYELRIGGACVGGIRYRREPGARALVHVDIEPRLEGHGLGSRLVEAVLDDLRARGLAVVPHALLVADFIKRHPEYRDLVTADTAVPD